MMGQTTVEHKGIAAVLKDSVVRVPTHQRPFSWQTGQIEEFLEDVSRAQSADQQHFLGTLVLIGEDESQELEVLDGQQRLATVAIVLACIADRLDSCTEPKRADAIRREYLWSTDIESGEPTPHLSLSSDDEPFFREMLKAGTALAKSDSNKRLQQAKEFVQTWLERNEDADHRLTWLVKLAMYLRNSARVIVLTVPDDANAFLIFETLNDRGLDLSIADLLKNYLLGLAKDDLPVALAHWTTATAALKAYGGENLFSVFLRHYWSSRYPVVRDKDLYRDIKSRVSTRSNALELADELNRHASLYAAIISPEHEYWASAGVVAGEAIRTLKLLGLEQYRPLRLAALAQFTQKNVESLLQLLVSWNVRLLIVGGLGGGTMERHYSQLARGIRNGDFKSWRDLAKEAKGFVPNDKLFQASFAEGRVSNVTLARYYLKELELYSRQKAGLSEEWQPSATLTLEHILPENPTSAWSSFTDDEAKAFRARIGNLTLLTKRLNSTLRNGPFAAKKKAYAESELLLTQNIATYTDWTPQAIETRQNQFAALAPLVWPLRLRSKHSS